MRELINNNKRSGLIFSFLLLILASYQTNAQCVMACNDQVNVSLGENCQAEVTAEILLEGNDIVCPGPKQVFIMNANGNPIAGNPMVSSNHLGQSYIVKVVDVNTANICWSNITIEDKIAPTVVCQDVTISCAQSNSPLTIGYPTVSDNCSTPSLTWTDNTQEMSCNTGLAAIITRTWKAVDNYNNSSICTQNITVDLPDLSEVVFPQNLDGVQLPTLQCGGNTMPAVTGTPTINGQPLSAYCQLMANYQDQVTTECVGSLKILRTWTVINMCSGAFLNKIQLIKVSDQTAPTITCPSNITIGTNSNACTGSLVLPSPQVSDACVSNSNITTSVQSATGTAGPNGIYYGLPLGMNIITYTAKDACDNSATCTFKITVKDDDIPTPICDELTIVGIQNDGYTIVYANTFDNGSYDNCGIQKFEVRRDSLPFDDFVTFNCNDSIEMVTLRVYDNAGNYNDCMVEIEVQDKVNPTVVCPPDKTVSCGTDYNNLGSMGQATAADNCSVASLTYNDIIDINNCGVGLVSRKWKVKDGAGLMKVCTQKIYIQNNDLFTGTDITWPLDYTTYQCGSTLVPTTLPIANSQPILATNACAQVASTYDDQVLPIAPPACFKVIRKWTVIDWCQYNGNTNTGIWTHTQILKVLDTIAPVITYCPANITVDNYSPNCGDAYATLSALTATDCSSSLKYNYTIDYFNDGQSPQSYTGANASGYFPNGIHKVSYKVEDGCGNYSACNFMVTVLDKKKPTVVCLNGLSANLVATDTNNNGSPDINMVVVWNTEFLASMNDNCTAANDLKLRVRKKGTGIDVPNTTTVTFTCDDLGPQQVELWVGDANNNWDYCDTYIDIQDNDNICNNTNTLVATVAGQIQNANGQNIEQVTVSLLGAPMPSITTGNNGSFSFANVPQGIDYVVAASKDINPLNGISTYDMVLISKHILGVSPFNSPYKIIAADINHSGSVTSYDMVQMRQLILNVIPTFPNNTSWRFVKKDYVFPNPANPFLNDIPETFNISDLATDVQANLIAIKVGDVNASATPSNLNSGGEVRSADLMKIQTSDKILVTGETYTAEFSSTDFDIEGFQFTLNYDNEKLDLVSVMPTETPDMNLGNFGIMPEKAAITSSWNGNAKNFNDGKLFTLTFRAKQNTTLSEALTLNSRITPAEAYTNDGEAMDIILDFGNKNQQENTFMLYQNQPNPFDKTTKIAFEVPTNDVITLSVFDIEGRLLKRITQQASKGYNEIILDASLLNATGVCYYQLSTASYTATKKMIIVR